MYLVRALTLGVLTICCGVLIPGTVEAEGDTVAAPVFKAYAYLDFDKLEFSAETGIRGGLKTLKKYARSEVHSPFYEARELDVYGEARAHGPQEPIRLTDTTFDEVWSIFRTGKPVIVTDATRDLPVRGYDCERIGKEFPNQRMKRSYHEITDEEADARRREIREEREKQGASFDEDGEDGNVDNNIVVGDLSWTEVQEPIKQDPADKGPDFAPFYWGVKELPTGHPAKTKIQSITRLPYFMRDSTLNSHQVNSTAELWFSSKKSGARAHADPHCESTMSIQLAGKKRWRLSLPSPVRNGMTTRRASDGDVDTARWAPIYEFTLSPGEALFFPPGMIHETTNVGDGCASSITYQWHQPAPTHYIRDFLPRIMMGESCQGCQFATWGIWSTLQRRPHVRTSLEDSLADAEGYFTEMDTDKDGYLSKAEVLAQLNTKPMIKAIESHYQLATDHGTGIAEDALIDVMSFLDRDEDGRVSHKEYLTSYQTRSAANIVVRKSMYLSHLYRKMKRKNKCRQKKRAQQIALQISEGRDEPFYDPAEHTADRSERAMLMQELHGMPKSCQQLGKKLIGLLKLTAIKITHNLDEQFPDLQSATPTLLGSRASAGRKEDL